MSIFQLTAIAFVVSASVFAVDAFLWDRRLLKVFSKTLFPHLYEKGSSRNLMLQPLKIYWLQTEITVITHN